VTAGLFLGLAALAGTTLVCLRFSLNAVRRKRMVEDTPTSKSTGVFMGMVELCGKAVAPSPATSHLAHAPCVHFEWSISEHWEKTTTETHTDSEGKTQTRTRTESGWTTVASGGETVSFFLRDDHGEVLVHPEGADLHTNTIFDETCTPVDALYFSKGPGDAIPHSTHKRHFQETAIVQESPVYVIGQARERHDKVAPEIAKSPDASLFVISVHGEKAVRRSFLWKIAGWFLAGGVSSMGFQAALAPETWEGPSAAVLEAPVLFFLLWCFCWAATVYNSLAGLRRRVDQASSNVDVMLKRRNDLIPALVDAVTGYASHEASVQECLARLRRLEESPGILGASLRAVAEAYPKLAADQLFIDLQKELSDTETRLALARSYYAEIATFFNTRAELIPDRWLCKILPGMHLFETGR
jgi:hypothetical protein